MVANLPWPIKYNNITVTKCGLCIHPEYCWLASSPDGFVQDPTSETSAGLLEIEYLYIADEDQLSPVEACQFLSAFSLCIELHNGKLQLKTNHNYYSQLQGQMAITKRDFVVMSKGVVTVDRIYFNRDFLENSYSLNYKQFT